MEHGWAWGGNVWASWACVDWRSWSWSWGSEDVFFSIVSCSCRVVLGSFLVGVWNSWCGVFLGGMVGGALGGGWLIRMVIGLLEEDTSEVVCWEFVDVQPTLSLEEFQGRSNRASKTSTVQHA